MPGELDVNVDGAVAAFDSAFATGNAGAEASPSSTNSEGSANVNSSPEVSPSEPSVQSNPTTIDDGNAQTQQQNTLPENVPYGRFKEVNDKYKNLEESFSTKVDEALGERLYTLASEDPALAKMLFKDDSHALNQFMEATGQSQQQPMQQQQPTQQSPQGTENPYSESEMSGIPEGQNEMLTQVNALTQEVQRMQYEGQMNKIGAQIDTEMNAHPIFKGERQSLFAEGKITEKLRQNPSLPVNMVVKEVADEMNALRQDSINEYVKSKETTAGQVPPTASSGQTPLGTAPDSGAQPPLPDMYAIDGKMTEAISQFMSQNGM